MTTIMIVDSKGNEKYIESFARLVAPNTGANRLYLGQHCLCAAQSIDVDEEDVLAFFWKTQWESPETAVLMLAELDTDPFAVYRAPTQVDKTFSQWKQACADA
jgi:hypothetical protein